MTQPTQVPHPKRTTAGVQVRGAMPGPRKLHRLATLLLNHFAGHARDLPWRRTLDPYAIWISEIMLQQTQVKTVAPYWERWMRELPTIQALARARPERVLKLWEGLGYYTRARNLQKAARLVLERHQGRFPERFDEVLALPGIGRYTAGAICSIAFNQPQPIVDGNVIRVFSRLFGIGEDPREKRTRERLWQLAAQLVELAAGFRSAFRIPHSALQFSGPCSALNQSLMELGATICTPRQPRCDVCPVRRHCVARRQGRVAELPATSSRAAATARRFAAFVLEHRGRFLIRRRPAGAINAGLWEFPNLELNAHPFTPAAAAAKLAGGPAHALSPFCTVQHTITRYRITLETYRGAVAKKKGEESKRERWCTPQELDRLPLTGAHGKIRRRLLSSL